MTPGHAGVVGHPIDHSLSPVLHAAAYAVLGEDLDYGARDLDEGELRPAVAELRGDGAWRGLSVTMPLKTEAAELADELTQLARTVGTVNTLVHRPDGTVLGHNTDVAGIRDALRSAGPLPRAPRAAVVGGGGTATAAVAALHELGAPSAELWVRSSARARRAVDAARRAGLPLRVRPLEEAPEHLAGCDVVVSTLPPHGADELAAGLASVRGRRTSGVLLDAAYDPWPSALARAWTRAGGAVVPGVDMLVLQALDQIRLFTGRDPGEALPRQEAVLEAMCRAVGRSELARALAVTRAAGPAVGPG